MPATTKRSRSRTGAEKKPRPATEKASSEDRLATYRAKRDFEVTPEPGSSQVGAQEEKKTAAPAPSEALAFVVQKHDARRLHYDVRLEVDGAMVSWAVPKGPSFDPVVRRLAVQTEDHPMAYNAFEGRIPDGEYGAGDVLIWDRGAYETVPPGQQRAMLDKGHLHVRLFGEKLVGDWHFIRTGRKPGDDGAGNAGKAQWLLFKAKDARANAAYDVVAERPESVVSGKAATRGPLRVGASDTGKSARALIEFVGEPALATADVKITRGDDWLFEIKYDGYRLVACKAGADVRLYTRRAHDWTDRFRAVAESVGRLPARECVVDGEACVLDDQGRLVNAQGQLIDVKGQLLGGPNGLRRLRRGTVIDANGAVVPGVRFFNGQLFDAQGAPLPSTDFFVNSQGQLVDAQGSVIATGAFINNAGQVVDAQGQTVAIGGRTMTVTSPP